MVTKLTRLQRTYSNSSAYRPRTTGTDLPLQRNSEKMKARRAECGFEDFIKARKTLLIPALVDLGTVKWSDGVTAGDQPVDGVFVRSKTDAENTP